MKIHLRCDSTNSTHANMSLFIDGRNCGTLCTGPAEAIWLHHALARGCEAISPAGKTPVEFVSSGEFPQPSPEQIDAAVL